MSGRKCVLSVSWRFFVVCEQRVFRGSQGEHLSKNGFRMVALASAVVVTAIHSLAVA